MASNREKLVNLIVANSNLEPSEATELIEEYTNNVADNEVENLINAMTEALGTKVGDKLDANGIKEVFDIAREHSNIKTDQEVAEEQARKQAIDEKQARRTEKAYEIIDQRREQKKEARQEKSIEQLYKEFREKETYLEKIGKNIKVNDAIINKIDNNIKKHYPGLSSKTQKILRKLFIQDEEEKQIKEQAMADGKTEEEAEDYALLYRIEKAAKDARGDDPEVDVDKKAVFRAYQKHSRAERAKKREIRREERASRKEIHPDVKRFDEAIGTKKELLEEYKKELEKNPQNQVIKARIERLKVGIEELEEGKFKISHRTIGEKAGYIGNKKFPNTYARLLDHELRYEKYRKQMEECEKQLKNPKLDEVTKQQIKEQLLNSNELMRKELDGINFEKVRGEEADFVLQGQFDEGELKSDNYLSTIDDYRKMITENEMVGLTTQLKELREKLQAPNLSENERMTLLNRMYIVEKNRLKGGLMVFGEKSNNWMATIQQNGGLTKDELFEVERSRIKKSQETDDSKKTILWAKNRAKLLEDVLKDMSDSGVSHDDIANLLLAIQKTREAGEFPILTCGKRISETSSGMEEFSTMMKRHVGPNVSTDVCLSFSNALCARTQLFSFEDIMKINSLIIDKAIAEERLKYDRTLTHDSKVEAVEPSKKVDKSTIRNIAAGVTKGEMDSITGTLAKDKNKPEITGQEQSETQTEIEA